MVFRPAVNLVLLVLIVLLGAALVFLTARRATRRSFIDIFRRSMILAVVVVMGAGRVLEQGPSDELLSRNGALRALAEAEDGRPAAAEAPR